MPTLKELSDPQVREQEAKKIVAMANQYGKKTISLNHGIRSDDELIKRIENGYNVQFDYRRLFEEAEKYD